MGHLSPQLLRRIYFANTDCVRHAAREQYEKVQQPARLGDSCPSCSYLSLKRTDCAKSASSFVILSEASRASAVEESQPLKTLYLFEESISLYVPNDCYPPPKYNP